MPVVRRNELQRRVRLTAERFTPRGRRDLALQIAIIASFELIYAVSGVYGRWQAEVAFANAQTVQGLEAAVGVGWEHQVQVWAASAHLLRMADVVYLASQFAVTTAVLLWIYGWHVASFHRVRNALIVVNGVQIIGLLVFPLPPPRLVPTSGVYDALSSAHLNVNTGLIDALNNPYSAMPSLHTSYAVVLGFAAAACCRRRWSQALWFAYPSIVIISVLASGNHYLLDVLVGVVAVAAVPAVERTLSRRDMPANASRLRPLTEDVRR